MKLNLLSFNVRGLNLDSAVDTMKTYIQNCRPALDIVTLQEHKVRGAPLHSLGDRLWRQATAFPTEATAGYGHDPLDPGAGCGGVITLIHPRWARHIGTSGTVLGNRLHWFILTGLPGGDIGFANIYAPNDSFGQCLLWEAMTHELPNTCRWVLLGDFNMVESRTDKTRQNSSMIPHRERILFDAMKSTL